MLTFKMIFIFTIMLSMYYGSKDGYASDSTQDGYGSDSTQYGYGSDSTQADSIIKNYQVQKNAKKTSLKQTTKRLLINRQFGEEGMHCLYNGNLYHDPKNKVWICDGLHYYDPENKEVKKTQLLSENEVLHNNGVLKYIRNENGSIRSKQGWSAWVTIDGKPKRLGNYQTKESAAERVILENLNENKRQEDVAKRVNLEKLQENQRQEEKEWLKIDQPLRTKINDLIEHAKSQKWYKDEVNKVDGISYDKYLKEILPLDFKRILLYIERDFPDDKTDKKKREHSVTALKSFMEFHFLPLDENFGFNKALFKDIYEEDEFYNKMKEVLPMQMFGVDKRNKQPVVYADSSLTNKKHWEFLEQTINKTPNGIEKIMYYKYRKVLRFVRAKNIETNTIGYTPVGEIINADVLMLASNVLTLTKMDKAKKYELGFRNATPNEEEIQTKCQILLTKDGIPQSPWALKRTATWVANSCLKDTYILSNDDVSMNLGQFIEINQIPKNYNGSGPEIEWYTDEPQMIHTNKN